MLLAVAVLGTGVGVILTGTIDAPWELRGRAASETSEAGHTGPAEDSPPLTDGDPSDASVASDSQETPSAGDGEAAARDLCDQRLARYTEPDNPLNAAVIASYAATAADAAAEHERQHGPNFTSPLRARQPGSFVAVCFFEAEAFGIPYLPGPGESLPPGVNTRLMEVVLPDGEALLLDAGRDDVVPASLPREGVQ